MQVPRRLVMEVLLMVLLVLLQGNVNGISQCSPPYPGRCDCDPPSGNRTGTRVWCRFLSLEVIPPQFPADTVDINFGYNNIPTVTADSFKNLPMLQKLILDSCNIETIEQDAFSHLTSLRVLNLTNNKINTLHPDTFQGLRNLDQLYLDDNLIGDVPDYLFYGLSLTQVNFKHNKLESIAEMAFHGAAIADLQMDHNNFLRISEQALGHLRPSLSKLALSHNKQPLDLESTVFSNFTFEELTLCDNGLMNTSFLKGTKAKYLDIGANPLHSVDFQDYSNLQYTHKFYLRNVSIDNLNEVTLYNLREVGLLDLSGNKLTQVHTDVFRFTPQLDILILSENLLTQVPRNLGVYLSDLRELDLQSNRISTLKADDFADLRNLHKLLLGFNQIQVMPQTIQPVFDRISIVRLDWNPLHCNCEMAWFRQWMNTYRSSLGVERCFTPQSVAGEYIFNLEVEDFVCSSPTVPAISSNYNGVIHKYDAELNSNLTVQLGETFRLICSAASDPAPRVEWTAPFGEVISAHPSRNRTKLKGSIIWKIENVRTEQAGIYTCSAGNVAGASESQLCVLIQDGDDIISDPCVFPSETTTTPEPPTTFVVTTEVVTTTAEDVITTVVTEPPVVTTAVEDTPTTTVETTSASPPTTTQSSTVLKESTAKPIRTTSPKTTRHRPSGSTPNTQASNSSGDDDKNMMLALIVGGSILGLVIIAVLIFGLCHSSKKRKEKRDYELACAKANHANNANESQA